MLPSAAATPQHAASNNTAMQEGAMRVEKLGKEVRKLLISDSLNLLS
jgi:hypothetical protein